MDEDGYKYKDKTELVAPKESVTLKAFVSANDPSGVKYEWKKRNNETGNYDDLFTEQDLQLLKADIQTIKDYLCKHSELLNEE